MDAEHLKKLGEEIARTLDKEGHPLFELKLQIGRLLSHLESEQRVTVRMERQMDVHEKLLFGDKTNLKDNPGLVNGVNQIIKAQTETKGRHNAVLTAVITLLVIEGAKLVFQHIK